MTTLPNAALMQHIAVLGKTGSGKTSTSKLAVEQVVAERARVCVLDPIKSDWWGLISSRDGKRPGLPFNVLGGPHGHVPLHSGDALIDYWRGRLGNSGKRRIFDAAVAAYPRALSYQEVSATTGIDTAGGTWRTYLGELRGLELIVGRGEIRASEALFS